MNPDLARLHPYPFQRMAKLLAGVTPPADRQPIALSIGEPKHPTPAFIAEALIEHLHGLSTYPTTRGSEHLRASIHDWLLRRFRLDGLELDIARQILPVNGTREALFAVAQCIVDRATRPLVMMPNPFYQIYEGAALLAGAEPYYINTVESQHYRPDFDAVPDEVWARVQLVYVCSPGNPTGAVLPVEDLQRLVEKADRFDFVIASDECYSEIYADENTPPPGLLEACRALGRDDLRRCLVFHSLSKRSNAPGLRSGFVAGDARLIEAFFHYRTYHGSAMPPPTQAASALAWSDETHVLDNRRLYRAKFSAVAQILRPVLPHATPAAAFYLWPETPLDDETFTRRLFAEENVLVLPGSYLSRDTAAGNPGRNRVRMALVAPIEECAEAALRIRRFVERL